jgi:uncharacterized iron-regulated protein
MLIQAAFVFTLLIIAFPVTGASFSLTQLLQDNDVVIVGETHRRPESTRFIANAAAEYLKGSNCLTIGLEIPSHQQPFLDRAFKRRWIPDRFSINSIPVGGFIDHPGYREMLVSFREQIWKGKCLKVRAIDKPQIVSLDRDEWMEKEILELIGRTPVLVLVGNFHAMKEVRWNSDPLAGPSLAERLMNRGVKVTSMLQYWEKKSCNLRYEKLVSTEEPESLEYVGQMMEAIHADAPDKASDVADAVVIWRCTD